MIKSPLVAYIVTGVVTSVIFALVLVTIAFLSRLAR